MASGKTFKKEFITREVVVNLPNLAAKQYFDCYQDASYSGYKPIGVIGWDEYTNVYHMITHMYITSNQELRVVGRNMDTVGSSGIKITGKILYEKI